MLSRLQRQVAHALLTRPPLSKNSASRRIKRLCSVRLECVMHAASVHPEPGSNSRKNYIKYPTPERQAFNLLRAVLSQLLYFCLSSILNKLWRDLYFALAMLCTSLLLFNFQWPFLAPAFRDSSNIISHHPTLVKYFFSFFFDFFSEPCNISLLFGATPLFYHFFLSLSIPF